MHDPMTRRAPARSVGGMTYTTHDTTNAASFDTALSRNRAFAAAGGHESAVIFPTLRLLVITCVDHRVDPAHFLELEFGDALVIRNGGGRVTPEVIEAVAFLSQLAEAAMPEGPLFEAAVIHHTQCGSRALADHDFRHRYAERIGADESELLEFAVLDPAASVVADAERLRFADSVSPRIAVSGHVYDLATGLVETVSPAASRAA
jgi:carbonic anhydrase